MTVAREPFPPGSDDARAHGCRCPVIDNGHGRGYMGDLKDPKTGETLYVMMEDCPIHGSASTHSEPGA